MNTFNRKLNFPPSGLGHQYFNERLTVSHLYSKYCTNIGLIDLHVRVLHNGTKQGTGFYPTLLLEFFSVLDITVIQLFL